MCGETAHDKFYKSVHGGYCKVCFNKLIGKKARDKKQKIVEVMGGKCCICGYSKYNGALELHHLDRSTKTNGKRSVKHWSWKRIETEIANCILVCANCHAEIEGGIIIYASVAQGKEQDVSTVKVVGSSPIRGTISH